MSPSGLRRHSLPSLLQIPLSIDLHHASAASHNQHTGIAAVPETTVSPSASPSATVPAANAVSAVPAAVSASLPTPIDSQQSHAPHHDGSGIHIHVIPAGAAPPKSPAGLHHPQPQPHHASHHIDSDHMQHLLPPSLNISHASHHSAGGSSGPSAGINNSANIATAASVILVPDLRIEDAAASAATGAKPVPAYNRVQIHAADAARPFANDEEHRALQGVMEWLGKRARYLRRQPIHTWTSPQWQRPNMQLFVLTFSLHVSLNFCAAPFSLKLILPTPPTLPS